MLLVGIVTGLLVLVLLVVVHELGHAIVARRNGVEVEEFGIGFPPTAWSKRLKNGVLFTLNWLPLGGFVRLKGEHDSATGKGTYGAASFWQKTKILFAGVVMNWVVAAALLTVLALVGLPKLVPNQVVLPVDARVESSPITLVEVVSGSAAEAHGFKSGDEIRALNNKEIENATEFIEATRANAGSEITISYEREGVQAVERVTLGTNAQEGVFGASIGQREVVHSTWSAPIVGVVTTAQLSWEVVSGLGELIGKLASGATQQFSGNETVRERAQQDLSDVSNSVAGPIGILGVLFPSAQERGVLDIVLLSAVISLTLAVMNALPIPALDGGRWWTMVVFRALKKKLTKEREETVQGIGFLVLMGLIILVTISDVVKLW